MGKIALDTVGIARQRFFSRNRSDLSDSRNQRLGQLRFARSLAFPADERELFLEKPCRRSLRQSGAKSCRLTPGVGFPESPKDQERFLEKTLALGEFLRVEPRFAQLIQTPGFTHAVFIC